MVRGLPISIYHFKGGIAAGLPFLGIIVSAVVSYIFYVFYLYPKFAKLNWKVAPDLLS